jgi:hypothetical protein
MKNIIGLIIILFGFFAPFVSNGVLASFWFFWIGFFLLLNPVKYIKISAKSLKWARKGLLANMIVCLIMTFFFYLLMINMKPVSLSIFLSNVFSILGWIGNPVRELCDLIFPSSITEMPDGSVVWEVSFMRSVVTTFFDILVYLLAGMLVGKYIYKDNVTHNHE